ncbi:hypothetical protein Pfo_004324 [Paulownia fortunei]|nr:hypothetical protein Pfo_004324 [Paulownia fortunei]
MPLVFSPIIYFKSQAESLLTTSRIQATAAFCVSEERPPQTLFCLFYCSPPTNTEEYKHLCTFNLISLSLRNTISPSLFLCNRKTLKRKGRANRVYSPSSMN